MTANEEYILEILESVGLINREQALRAREAAQQEDKGVADVLARSGVVSKMDILKALAGQFGMETISITGLELPQEVLDLVPGEVVATMGSDVLRAEMLKNNLGEGCTCGK